MLAKTPIEDTYLSAEQLGIREDEREALIAVRNDLASGRIRKSAFDMSTTGEMSCGTVACIGGHMGMRLGIFGRQLTDFVGNHLPLKHLFYPYNNVHSGQTRAQAVRAIDAWLTGAGDRCWHIALKSEG